MSDQELRDEVVRLRHDVDMLTQAVARLIQDDGPPPDYQAYLAAERAGHERTLGGFADWPGRPRPDLVPEFAHNPPQRPAEDRLPRGGRNPRIFCERHDSGTWIHGDPHNCPTWARR